MDYTLEDTEDSLDSVLLLAVVVYNIRMMEMEHHRTVRLNNTDSMDLVSQNSLDSYYRPHV